MAKDAELRWKVLEIVHRLRHANGGRVPISSDTFSGFDSVTPTTIQLICHHLSQAGLIEWNGHIGGGGVAQITGAGVDAFEGHGPSPLFLAPPDKPRQLAGSAIPTERTAQDTSFEMSGTPGAASSFGTVGEAILANAEALETASWSVLALVTARLDDLREGRPNSDEAQQLIAAYETLRRSLETFLSRVSAFIEGAAGAEPAVVSARLSFVDGLKEIWAQRHLQIADVGLLGAAVSICYLSGPVPTVVAGAIVGGSKAVDAIKAVIADRDKAEPR